MSVRASDHPDFDATYGDAIDAFTEPADDYRTEPDPFAGLDYDATAALMSRATVLA